MTELRDARLRKAMDEAPDAQLRPQARTREAIRAAAHAALQPAWKRWWLAGGRSGTPWAAAFATIALATLVTVLWQDEEVPGARSDTQVATAPAPVAAEPPPSPARLPVDPPPLPSPAPPSAPAGAPFAIPAPAAPAPSLEDRASQSRAARSAAAPPVRAPAPGTSTTARQRDAVAEAQRSDPGATSGGRDLRARRELREDRTAAAPSQLPMAPAPAPPPPPPPSPAAAPPSATPPALASAGPQRQAAAAAPSAPAPAARPAAAAPPWTQLRIEAGGRSVVVPRSQAGELPALVTSMLASPSEDADPPVGQRLLRLELAQGDEAAGVLELVGEQWRWTSLRESRGPRLLRPDEEVAAGLRRQATALLPK